MKTLLLCGIYPEKYKETLFKNSKKGYQFAAQNLQEAIITGFLQNESNISIITTPFLSTFPFGYKNPIVKHKKSLSFNQVETTCSTYVNIPFLNNVLNTAQKDVFDWCKSMKGEKINIIVYSLYLNLMKIAIKAKNKFKNVKISIIIPDLPEHMGVNIIYKKLGFKNKIIKDIYSKISFFDYFIFLSENMSEHFNIEPKNYIVVEGIFNPKIDVLENIFLEKNTTTILYTGTLSVKYGIQKLINAFKLIPNKDFRLIICGDGNARNLVEESTLIDQRINYLGKVAYEEILGLQKNASLLINPRTPEGDYTKFSFPSKTMEYFASGTPVLMYKLPGIPKEYFEYCFTLNDVSEYALSKKITEILELSNETRNSLGEKAKQYIFEQKNAKVQVKKILELINI